MGGAAPLLHYATAMEQLTLTMLNLRTIVEVTHTARVCVRAGGVESRRRFEFVRGSKCAQGSPMAPPFSLLYAERVGALLDDVLAGRWLPATWQTRIYSPCELPVRVERCVRVLGPRGAWRAYTDSAQIFCAIARVGSLASRVRPQERANGDPSGSSVGRSGGIRPSAVRVGCASSKRGQYVSPLGWSELQARGAKTRLMIN